MPSGVISRAGFGRPGAVTGAPASIRAMATAETPLPEPLAAAAVLALPSPSGVKPPQSKAAAPPAAAARRLSKLRPGEGVEDGFGAVAESLG